jgi:phosphate transport system protein
MPMARKAQAMLRRVLDALVERDADAARRVCAADDEVDQMHRQVYERVKLLCRQQPEHATTLIHLLSVSRYLERIADLATNIAEDVIYMSNGEIVRHGGLT